MDNLQIQEVREAQDLMLAASQSCLVGSEPGDLRALIRITIEFFYFLEGHLKLEGVLKGDETNYAIDTVFSGVDSFMSLSASSRMITNNAPTAVNWDQINRTTLWQVFLALYQQFRSERNFERQFRLLLDLFRLQLIFAGMNYD
jgi:hypothetical protein